MNTSLASAAAADDSDTAYFPRRPRTLRGAIERVLRSIRSLGPYLAIELILPGGSIIALALWTYRHRRAARGGVSTVSTAIAPAVRRALLRFVTPCTER